MAELKNLLVNGVERINGDLYVSGNIYGTASNAVSAAYAPSSDVSTSYAGHFTPSQSTAKSATAGQAIIGIGMDGKGHVLSVTGSSNFTASFATSASKAVSASYATNATSASRAVSASRADSAASATSATTATTASYNADGAAAKSWITANSGNLGKSPFIPGEGSGSAVLSGSGATATGQFAVAEGTGSVAIGNYSHAEGRGTTASGSGSHAEGLFTTASGPYSHAEGTTTKASGYYSHAEGSYVTASGNFSHAEGYKTVALNEHEHAAGKYNAKAFGQIFSIGVGDAEARRKNAISVVAGSNPSASVYIYGVGGYDGTNPTPGENDIASFLGIAPLEAIDALFVEGGGGGSSS